MEIEQFLVIGTGLATLASAFGGIIWKLSSFKNQLQSEIRETRRQLEHKIHAQELHIVQVANRVERDEERGSTGIKEGEMKYQHLRNEVKDIKKQLQDVRFYLAKGTFKIRANERPDIDQ